MDPDLQFLVQWEPRWGAFSAAVATVLRRSAGTAKVPYIRTGISLRGPFISLVAQAAVLFGGIVILPLVVPLRDVISPSSSVPPPRVQEVVYFSPTLPEVSDAGGAAAGRTGKSGGDEFYHPIQAIRISRSSKRVPIVVEAPSLKLPRTPGTVANLLSFGHNLPAPPMTAISALQSPAVSLGPGAAVEPPAKAQDLRTSALPLQPIAVPPAPALRDSLPPKLQLPAIGAVPPPPNVGRYLADVEPLMNSGTSGRGDLGIRPGAPANEVADGMVISVHPGGDIGMPEGGSGSLAMSAAGGNGGVGGAGGGSGIGTGQGSGSGSSGTGSGAGNSGNGLGANRNAHGGISLAPGPGGAGGARGGPSLPGVSISGGVIHIPSIAASGGASPASRNRNGQSGKSSGIVVVAAERAGGGIPPELAPRGGRVYTMYLDTPKGNAILQYADPSDRPAFEADLKAPNPVRTDVSRELMLSGSIVACDIDQAGRLRNFKVVRLGARTNAVLLLRDLENWAFTPVMRGTQPIHVKTVIGFDLDTR